MDGQLILAVCAGAFVGALFRFVEVPIPAPPSLTGILGIVGIFLGYKLVDRLDVSVDLLALLNGLF